MRRASLTLRGPQRLIGVSDPEEHPPGDAEMMLPKISASPELGWTAYRLDAVVVARGITLPKTSIVPR